MKFSSDLQLVLLTTITLFIGLINSQQGIPACAKTCTSQLTLSSCSTTDFSCVCNSTIYVGAIAQCVKQSCTAADDYATANYFLKLCAAVGVNLDLGAYNYSSSAATLYSYASTSTATSYGAGIGISSSATTTSNTIASATSSDTAAAQSVQHKLSGGQIAGIVSGSVAGVILLAAIGFYFGRSFQRRGHDAVPRCSAAEEGQGDDRNNAYDDNNNNNNNNGVTKGIAELSSPLVSPVTEPQKMTEPFGQVQELDSGYSVPQGDLKLSELHHDEKVFAELPGDSVVYEK